MPAPYDYGSQRGAWATHLVTNWPATTAGWPKCSRNELSPRTLLINGKVTGKWRGAKAASATWLRIPRRQSARRRHHARDRGGRVAFEARRRCPSRSTTRRTAGRAPWTPRCAEQASARRHPRARLQPRGGGAIRHDVPGRPRGRSEDREAARHDGARYMGVPMPCLGPGRDSDSHQPQPMGMGNRHRPGAASCRASRRLAAHATSRSRISAASDGEAGACSRTWQGEALVTA